MTAAQKRDELVRLYLTRTGKNDYTQARPCYFFGKPEGKDPGKSDCSGSIRDAILRVLGVDIGGNTSAQVDNAKAGKKGMKIIQTPSGTQFDESKLKKGDLLYFRGNSKHTDNVGHVEMYTGPNQCVGHGGGKGPTVKNLKTYCASRTGARRALYAVRFIHDEVTQSAPYKLGDRALCRGMVASDVGELQALLVKLKYNLGPYGPAKDGVDNEYGDLTAKAVKDKQKKHGLAMTSDADLVTIQTIIAAANAQPVPTAKQRARVTGGTVNVRSGPSTKYKALGVVKSGSTYDLMGASNAGWYGIMYNGKQAYISAKYAVVEK